jgi:transcriptional regulator with XRE-family HTH domain
MVVLSYVLREVQATVMKRLKQLRRQEEEYLYLSAGIVKYLRDDRNMTLKQIGKLAGVSESFVSRVARRLTSFRCKHLENIEQGLGEPVGLLQLQAIVETAPEEDREIISKGLAIITQANGLARHFRKFGESATK